MILKLQYLVSLFLISLTLSDFNGNDGNSSGSPCLLKEHKAFNDKSNSTNGIRYKYNYGEANQLISISVDSVYQGNEKKMHTKSLKFDSRNRIIEVSGAGNIKNEYNIQGQLVKQVQKQGSLNTNIIFNYNAAGELSEVQKYSSEINTDSTRSVWKYIYSGGNPVRIEQYSGLGEILWTATFTYDNQPAMKSAFVFEPFEPLKHITSANNITTMSLMNTTGLVEGYRIAYTYNTEGHPVKVSKTFTSGYTETVVNSYICN